MPGFHVECYAADLLGLRQTLRSAPGKRSEARFQLIHVKRLDQIIVGACVQSLDSICRFRPGRQQQDRTLVCPSTHVLENGDTVESRQVHVQYDNLRIVARQKFVRLQAIVNQVDRVTGVAQAIGNALGQAFIVFNDDEPQDPLTTA